MTKPTKPTVPPAPSRANLGPVFSQTADTFAAFQAPFADYIDAVADFVDERADEALAAATAGDLPPIAGQGGSFLRAKPDGTAAEFRTPAQVRADLSINGIGSETAPTITNLNTLTVAGEYVASGTATGVPDNDAYAYLVKHYVSDVTANSIQETFRVFDGARFWRREFSGVWQPWQQVQPALGFTPVEQGGGAGMGSSKVRIGWSGDGAGLRLRVDDVDLGFIALRSELPNVIAAQGTGAVGTYALLFNADFDATIATGATIAGSNLRYAATGGAMTGGAPPGTWRCMGFSREELAERPDRTTLYLRIS
jgi:hypothetical protein